jgi:hypothetical protein
VVVMGKAVGKIIKAGNREQGTGSRDQRSAIKDKGTKGQRDRGTRDAGRGRGTKG